MKVPLYLSILVSVCLLGCKTAKQQPALVHESGQSLSEIKTLMEKGKSYFISTTQYPNYLPDNGVFIIRKSKFPQNPKRSVRFSGKRTKRSVQKRKARNTQKAETKVL